MEETKEILLAQPRGFCAGVDRAIEIVERAIAQFGAPIYVRHEIVHNRYVVDELSAKGAIFVEDLSDVPPGSHLVFSAHGVSRAVKVERERRLSGRRLRAGAHRAGRWPPRGRANSSAPRNRRPRRRRGRTGSCGGGRARARGGC